MKDDQKTKKQIIEELNELRECIAELKGFKEKIEQSRTNQEKFTKAFLQNSIPVGLTTLEEGRFVEVNNSFLKLLGCTREEVIGYSLIECGFITEDQRAAIFDELNKKGHIENLEVKITTKDGALRDGLFNAVLMTVNNEKYLLIVIIDVTARKQAEEALHRSEKKFRTLYDSTSDAVMFIGEKNFLDCNKATLVIFGCETREEFCRKHPADLSPSRQPCGTDSIVLANQMIATAVEKGSAHFEWMHMRNDTGEVFPADVLLTAIELDGKPVVQALVRDITERKQAEKKSQSTLNFLQTLINTIPSPIFCKDINGLYQECNKEFEDYTGCKKEDIIGKGVYEMYPKDVADKYNEMDSALFREPGRQIYEHPIIYADGNRHDVVVNKATYLNADGTMAGMVGVMVDITERKRAEEELRESQAKYQLLFNNSLDAIAVLGGMPPKFLFINPAFLRLFGYTLEEILAFSAGDIFLLVHPEDRKMVKNLLHSRFSKKDTPSKYESRIVTKDGKVRWVEVTASLFFNKEQLWSQAIYRDVTDRKQADEVLAKYREGLEQLVEERTQELENKTKTLEELNIALKVLLQHRDADRKELEDRFVINVKNLIIPFAEKMKGTHLDERQLAYLSIIETHLNDITSSMIKKMHQFNFTPTEVEVASLIKEGKATKKIAGIMGIATSSIDTHRNNIRKKLGISKKNVNLRSQLQSFDQY